MRVGYTLKRLQDAANAISLFRSMKARERWNRQELERFQHQQLSRLVRHAVTHSPPSLRRVDTYMAGLPLARVIKAVQLVAKLPGIVPLMQQHIMRGSNVPTEEQRSQRRFTILHEISGEKDCHQITKCYAISGRDPYSLTAQCISEMAERLNKGLYSRSGVCSPASTFDAVSFVKKLQAWGVTFTPINRY